MFILNNNKNNNNSKNNTDSNNSKENNNNTIYKRIIAHTDFDGTISALFLREMFDIDNIRFTEPWLIQSGKFWIKEGDIIVDLPFHEKASLWIDHHKSTSIYDDGSKNRIYDSSKKSCPALIYEKFHEKYPILEQFKYLIEPSNKIDAAEFTKEDLKNPDEFGKLSISMRSDDRKKDDEFRLFLINMLSYMKADQVIKQPIIKARVDERMVALEEWKTKVKEFVQEFKEEKVLVVDLCNSDIPRGQKFWLYLMYPNNSHSIIIDDIKNSNLVKISVGKNIFEEYNREIDISELMKKYGGGGHKDVGGCGVPKEDKEQVIKEIIKAISES